jgi:amino acid adenylation domain-containing protein
MTIKSNPEMSIYPTNALVEETISKIDCQPQICIQQLFESQVERSPEAVAVVFEDQQLTYGQLNRYANQLAHHLVHLGVETGTLVGLCVERSLEMVVGLLAILKAGGAYVPLDPAYPKDRLAYILGDTQVKVLLVQEHLQETLSEYAGQSLYLALNGKWPDREKTENLISVATLNDLIAVIYTSGSTGKPKGVMLKQGSYLNLCRWYEGYCHITDQSRALLGYSFSFDASFRNIITPLLVGGQLLLTKSFEPLELLKVIEQNQVTMFATTPSLFLPLMELAATNNYQSLSSLEELSFGGEPLYLSKIKPWLKSGLCNCNITNVYGTTESADVSTAYVIKREEIEKIDLLDKVPVGSPINNQVEVYLLDEEQNLQREGLAGELCITHIGNLLAEGYLHKPELTAEKFVPNPWLAGERLYKTGDLARWMPDGNLELLGRIDHQVKLHGVRIEIGEIEAALREYETIQDAVVITRDDLSDRKVLVAYLVANPEMNIVNSELRDFLIKKLPSYMIPSFFVILEKLPLSPNGKIDRLALPAPAKSGSQEEKTSFAIRDTLEMRVAKIWQEILDVPSINIKDNFFDLGGDSILALILMTRIRQEFGQDLQLSTLFDAATIEHQACILRQQKSFQSRSPLIEIQPKGSKPPLFFVHPAGGNVLCYVDLASYLTPDYPLFALQAKGLDGESEPFEKVEDMAAYYIEAIRTVQPESPYFLGGWSMGGIVAFEMARQLQEQGQEVNLLALIDIEIASLNSDAQLTKEDEVNFLASFAQDLGLSFESLNLSRDLLLNLKIDEQLTYLLNEAKIAELLPPDVGFSHIHRLFHVFKTHAHAIQKYQPRIYPGRVTLFQAREQLEENLQDSTMGWNNLAVEGVDVNPIPGNHYTSLRKPHVQVLAEKLKACIEKFC